MSSITRTSLTFAVLLVLSVFTLAGCGSSNSQSTFDSASGKHPAGWLPAGHKPEAVAHLEDCIQCHGADYKGGSANVSCHGAALTGISKSGPSCTLCHLGGVNSFHPTEWGTSPDLLHKDYVKVEGTTG